MDNQFEKLGNFINSFGAACLLLREAHKDGSLLEGLVLYASIIDGFCRIALVLKEQIINKTQSFDERYIFQGEEDKDFFTEKKIYKLCLEKNIIDQDLFDEIVAMYDVRNKAIHRFLITNIEYTHLEILLDRYELIFQRMRTIVYGLESRQIAEKVGMTISKSVNEEEEKKINDGILCKINSNDKEKIIETLGEKLIRNKSNFNVKEEREHIHNEITEEIEIQEEKKKIPTGYSSVKEITKWAERKGLLNKCICGHEKICHIDKNNLSIDGSGRCNESDCVCKEYRE